ncbi:hypothetical protein M885DRAFT_532364 [Pelagophyceae sp. CCMP2097]|nr:hypothetical protein M885DRAFT_532364 [Pelagophyceae sp. CCMP2097]
MDGSLRDVSISMFSWTRWRQFFGVTQQVLQRADDASAPPSEEEAALSTYTLRLRLCQGGALLFSADAALTACADVELFDIREHEERLGRTIAWVQPHVRQRMLPKLLERIVWCDRVGNQLKKDLQPWDAGECVMARRSVGVLRQRLPDAVVGLIRNCIPHVRKSLEPLQWSRSIEATLAVVQGRRTVLTAVGVPVRDSFGFRFSLEADPAGFGASDTVDGPLRLSAMVDFEVEDFLPRSAKSWRSPIWRDDLLSNDGGYASRRSDGTAIRHDEDDEYSDDDDDDQNSSLGSVRAPRRTGLVSMGVRDARCCFYLGSGTGDEPRSGSSCSPTPAEFVERLRSSTAASLLEETRRRYSDWLQEARQARLGALSMQVQQWYGALLKLEAELLHDSTNQDLQDDDAWEARAEDYVELSICVQALQKLTDHELELLGFRGLRSTFISPPPGRAHDSARIDDCARDALRGAARCLGSKLPDIDHLADLLENAAG